MEQARQNYRLQIWITALSVFLFAVKITAYYFTQSLAVLTDALESIVNVLAGFIGLYSLYVASKPRDFEHPYGHGKAEFVSAAVEGTLIVTSGVFILYETIENLFSNKPIQQLDLGIVLLGLTGIINYAAGYVCLNVGKRNNSLALETTGKHLQIDTYSTIAIIAGLSLMLFTGLHWLDKVIALVLSFFILRIGYKIIRTSLAGIMDEADIELLKQLVATLNQNRRENWVDLHNLRVIKYGSTLHLDCHLTVPWYLNVNEAHIEVDELKEIIIQTFGDAIELFVHTDGCMPFGCPICIKKECHVRQHPFTHRMEWTLENISSNQKHNVSQPTN